MEETWADLKVLINSLQFTNRLLSCYDYATTGFSFTDTGRYVQISNKRFNNSTLSSINCIIKLVTNCPIRLPFNFILNQFLTYISISENKWA